MEEIIFPNKIRILRKMAGKSMQELADELKVSLSAVSKIEKGFRKINQQQMNIVARFIDCSVNDIFITKDDDDEILLEAWKKEIDARIKLNKNNGLKIFGAGLRYIRTEKKLTLIEVAEKSGLTLSVYHRIEIGQRDIYEGELIAIAKALNSDVKKILTTIYDLNKAGKLSKYLDSDEPISLDTIVKMNDTIRSTENVYTTDGVIKFSKVLCYSKTIENGNMLIDKNDSERNFVTYPIDDKKLTDIYAIELSGNRLGDIIPQRSILFINPNADLKHGDIAVQVVKEQDSKKEIRLLHITEDVDGMFYGNQYNPNERVKLSKEEVKTLHKVIFISMN